MQRLWLLCCKLVLCVFPSQIWVRFGGDVFFCAWLVWPYRCSDDSFLSSFLGPGGGGRLQFSRPGKELEGAVDPHWQSCCSRCWAVLGGEELLLVTSRFLSHWSLKLHFPLLVSNAFNCRVVRELLPVGSGTKLFCPVAARGWCQLPFLIASAHPALTQHGRDSITSVPGAGTQEGGFCLCLNAKHLPRNVLIWCLPISGMRCSCISVEIDALERLELLQMDCPLATRRNRVTSACVNVTVLKSWECAPGG